MIISKFNGLESVLKRLRILAVSSYRIEGGTNFFEVGLASFNWDYLAGSNQYRIATLFKGKAVGFITCNLLLNESQIELGEENLVIETTVGIILDKLGKYLTDRNFYVEVIDD